MLYFSLQKCGWVWTDEVIALSDLDCVEVPEC
jgi:hypothetical protein